MGPSGAEAWRDPFAIAVEGGTKAPVAPGKDPAAPSKSSFFGDDVEIVSIKSLSFWKRTPASDVAFWCCTVFTLGLAPLIAHWNLQWLCSLRYARAAASDPDAELVLVESLDEVLKLAPIDTLDSHSAARGWISRRSQDKREAAQLGSPEAQRLPRSFEWRSERFWHDPATGAWLRFRFNLGAPIGLLHQHGAACAFEDNAKQVSAGASLQERRFLTYGSNILHVDIPSFFTLLVREVVKPFFVFQVFSFAVWFTQGYFLYCAVVLFLSLTSVTYESFLTWQHFRNIKRLAETECTVTRLVAVPDASGQPRLQPESVSSSSLMPGDLVQLEAGMVFPCDLLLLAGQCVVNEAMLTGESAPVLKTSLPINHPNDRLRPESEADSKYRLLSGTTVLQARAMPAPPAAVPAWDPQSTGTPPCVWNLATERKGGKDGRPKGPPLPVVAVVAGTGFSTAKGELVRAILYPKPSSYDFEKKLYYFVANLVVFCAIACGITLAYQIGKLPAARIVANILNLITITIPPALPLSLSVGLSIAFTRLSRHGVFCISPPRVINAGRVNTLCFDKTGTLTRDGLTMRGALPLALPPLSSPASGQQRLPEARPTTFGNFADDLPKFYQHALKMIPDGQGWGTRSPGELSPQLALTQVLAACHSLSVLHPDAADSPPQLTINGKPGGRPQGRQSGGDGGVLGWGVSVRNGSRQSSGYERTSQHGSGVRDAWGEDADAEEEEMAFVGLDGKGGTFVGDPLEVQMFRASGWNMLYRPDDANEAESQSASIAMTSAGSRTSAAVHIWENPGIPPFVDAVVVPPDPPARTADTGPTARGTLSDAGYVLSILRRFDFDSEIKRMAVLVGTVLTDDPNSGAAGAAPPELALLVKGAPETLQPLCHSDTVPADFEERLHDLALNGNRILAAAYRPLAGMPLEQAMQAPRSDLEKGLSFLGFLVLENELKHETAGFLDAFARAGLRSVMVTGDNPLTAVAVARKCGPHFLLRQRNTFLVDSAPETQSTAAQGATGSAPSTRCVLKDLFGPRSIALDELFPGPEGPLPPPRHQGTRAADLVVTGRAFEALKAHHDAALAIRSVPRGSTTALGPRSSTGSLLHSISFSTSVPAPTPLEAVLARAGVFARMSAGNKRDLMLCLRDLGYSVCMTGDGANDSGALKAADVGVSISAKQQHDVASPQASFSFASLLQGRKESGSSRVELGQLHGPVAGSGPQRAKRDDSVSAAPSIAAPFSTSCHHIGAVEQVLVEGRCTLVSAVTMFKYMLFYGVIQTTALVVLYPFLLELAEPQYLWGDLALVFPMVFLMPAISPKKELTRGLPESNLFATSILVSAYGQVVFIVGFQLLATTFLQLQSWYAQPGPSDPGFNKSVNMHSTESFLFSSFQYTFLALALSQSFGKFRKYLHQCYLLALVLIVQFVCTSVFLLAPTDGIISTFHLYDLRPYPDFCLALWVLAVANGLVACLFERFVVRHTSSEPEVLALTHGSTEAEVAGGAGSVAKKAWHERVRSWWEDSQGLQFFIPCRPAPQPRYATVLAKSTSTWNKL